MDGTLQLPPQPLYPSTSLLLLTLPALYFGVPVQIFLTLIIMMLWFLQTPDMLEYQIIGESFFRVATYFGLGFVMVNQQLDYEQTQHYSFVVSAIWRWAAMTCIRIIIIPLCVASSHSRVVRTIFDIFLWFKVYAIEKTPEKRNTSCLVNITVLDVNDHYPVFVNSSYSGSVLEGAGAGTTVLNVRSLKGACQRIVLRRITEYRNLETRMTEWTAQRREFRMLHVEPIVKL